jgi:hypothetical protein
VFAIQRPDMYGHGFRIDEKPYAMGGWAFSARLMIDGKDRTRRHKRLVETIEKPGVDAAYDLAAVAR